VGVVEAVNSTTAGRSRSYYESYEAKRDSKNQHAFLRHRATELGADVVLLTDEKPDRIVGQAYRCRETR
jgi:hypothetical protein